jgi:hypothetical protein
MEMKLRFTSWLLRVTVVFWPLAALAQLELLPDVQSQQVFGGAAQNISVVWRNTGDKTAEADIRARIIQTSSATVIPLVEVSWKKLDLLPQQTVIESAQLDFPAVRAETKFLVQWLDATNHVFGNTEVLVYPTNLLDELELLVDKSAHNLGVLDPQSQIKPTLKRSAVRFVDLAETELNTFTGKMAVIGPCRPDDPEWNGLADRISKLAKKGTPVVWIQSSPKQQGKILPSFYIVPQNRAVVIVVQPGLVSDLSERPQSQLNLRYFCKLALNPLPPALPDLSPQP